MASGFQLDWSDYLILAIIFIISIVIGLIPACTGGKQRTTDEYISGNRKLRLFPVALSLLVTYMSGITLLGVGTETYFFGIQYIFWMVGQIMGAILAMVMYVPLLYPLGITSTNEYIEMRFGSRVLTLLGTVIQIMDLVILNAFVLLGPAFVFNTVSDFPIWASIIIIGVASSFYTALGGIKAVVWTDVFQGGIMLTGVLAVIIQGTILVGGPQETWRLYKEGGRIFVDFTPSPFKRLDFWSVGVLQSTMWVCHYGVLQMGVQRFNSLPTYRDAMTAMALLIPMNLIMLTLCAMMGVIAYGYYASVGCDPYRAGYIKNVNQIIPHLVLDILDYPCLPGIFFAAIFAGALSNLSSSLAGIAAFLWKDLIQRHVTHVTEFRRTCINKGLVILFGAISTGCAFLVADIGGTLVQMAVSIHIIGVVPIAVLFTLGAAWPKANSWSAGIGSVLSLALIMWMSVGANVYRTNQTPLPTNIDNCPAVDGSSQNVTMAQNTSYVTLVPGVDATSRPHELPYGLQKMYSISYLWFATFGIIFGTVIGVLLSFIPGLGEKGPVNERYLFRFLRPFWRRVAPGWVRTPQEDVDMKDVDMKDVDMKDVDMKDNRDNSSVSKRCMYPPLYESLTWKTSDGQDTPNYAITRISRV